MYFCEIIFKSRCKTWETFVRFIDVVTLGDLTLNPNDPSRSRTYLEYIIPINAKFT